MIVPRSERFAALPQFLAFWASVLAVVLLGRRLGLSRPAATYGGLVFATLPVVLLHSAAILNDLVVASLLLAAVVLLVGRSRGELVVGCVALGLALSTKFSAALALPILVAAVVALVPAQRRGASLVACGAGVLLGAPWYVVNLVETGSLDGGLADSTGQHADHSVRGVLGTLRALAFDIADTSGLWHSELYVAVGIGAAMIGVSAILAARGATSGRALAAGGLLVALVPLLLRAVERPVSWGWRHFWFKLGHEGISLDHGDAWKVLGLPDTSLSWYGAAGSVVILGGVAAAIVGVRRGMLRRAALVLALAPLGLLVVFAFTIVYDPWRGRLAMFAVGLACAVWGWTIRVRWLSVGVAGLCATTVALSLVHWYTKPSGLGLLEPSISRSVWHRDRIDALTVVRDYDGTAAMLRALEENVPPDAVLAVATPIDTFLAPLAGPRLSRTLRLVPHGDLVPPEATWLVSKGERAVSGCTAAWATVYANADTRWRLLRRTAPDACGAAVAPL
jgi:4-amino-4-deoxy-L-arabinose transferase-like glycosyltransferase